MTKISILYPTQGGSRFDFDYYLRVHIPMSIKRLKEHPGFKGISVEKGTGSTDPDMSPPYRAMCHFTFTSMDDFMAAFLPHQAELQGDIKNYTDIKPLVQVSEVLLSG